VLNKTIAAAVLLAAAAGIFCAARASADRRSADRTRSATAFAAMQRYFDSTGPVYTDAYPPAGSSSAWSFSQALAATVSLARTRPAYRPVLASELELLRYYQRGDSYTPYPSRGSVYLDDNEWLGQDLVAAYRELGERWTLQRAARIFGVVTRAWDGDTHDACSGGVFWTRDPSNSDRNTVSTANGALLALDLYRATNRSRYLAWAKTMYGWVNRCLAQPDGLYADHVSRTGKVAPAEWSYNQGAMIAAAAGLYTATGDRAYLAQANAIAQTALARFEPTNFSGEPSAFVAIFFRDLKRLAGVSPSVSYRDAAQRYADSRWSTVRDPRTGLFHAKGSAATLLDQAAVVELYAQLSE